MSLPSADDLFRPTAPQPTADPATDPSPAAAAPEPAATPRSGTSRASAQRAPASAPEPGPRKPSGRVRHDEKMTVYLSSEELLEIEHARLALRRHHGLAVDRGRLVREAVAMVLADLEAHGEQSALVRRLSEE